uniref:Interleukin n=1 Tax=Catharus ustulatus TaxID=91951 RepID=A0A8C3VKD0_CATUS
MCKVLILGCIAVAVLMTAAYGASLQKCALSPAERKRCYLHYAIMDLRLLKHIDNVSGDFLLSEDSFECNHTTLACFLKELKVLKEDVEESDKQHVMNIEKNLEDPHFSDPTCKKCESHEKKKFAEFHEEMTSFLQSMEKQVV